MQQETKVISNNIPSFEENCDLLDEEHHQTTAISAENEKNKYFTQPKFLNKKGFKLIQKFNEKKQKLHSTNFFDKETKYEFLQVTTKNSLKITTKKNAKISKFNQEDNEKFTQKNLKKDILANIIGPKIQIHNSLLPKKYEEHEELSENYTDYKFPEGTQMSKNALEREEIYEEDIRSNEDMKIKLISNKYNLSKKKNLSTNNLRIPDTEQKINFLSRRKSKTEYLGDKFELSPLTQKLISRSQAQLLVLILITLRKLGLKK